MAKIYKKHGSSFRLKVALEAIKGQKTIAELCQDFGVASSQIYAWRKQLEDGAQSLFESKRPKDHQEEIDKLHRVIGKITAERDFLERVLKR
jgi:transposase